MRKRRSSIEEPTISTDTEAAKNPQRINPTESDHPPLNHPPEVHEIINEIKPNGLEEDEQLLVNEVANELGLALENARLYVQHKRPSEDSAEQETSGAIGIWQQLLQQLHN